ncbi:arginine--tRNA ligase [Mitsuokella sp. oral taxon 131 str. W9106]|nr:arginine--tRNA ligase [Mitsuokella sp. oral taxon 131 str. W9106]
MDRRIFLEIKDMLAGAIEAAVKEAIAAGALPAAELPQVTLEVPPSKDLGDFATNFAMQSARVFHKSPRQIAEEIRSRIAGDFLDHAEIAGPGFLNFYLKGTVLYDALRSILAAGESYGNLPAKDVPKTQVEYVSANPTGLLHVGHGRGAAAGSALVNLLRAAGYPVESEYYINDAGNQMDNLARSVNARYLELLGTACEFPEDGYHGADITETARRIIEKDGAKYLALPEKERLAVLKELAYKEKLAVLKDDLAAFHVTYDKWFSERTLHPDAIQEVIAILRKNGTIYEKDGALWLRSTDYGDDKDRVVIRDNGVPTYLAADIAYHHNKYERGFGTLINIWGADHHGYVCRVKAAMEALGHDPKQLHVLLLQMVSLYRGGELVKMSKRTGQSVTLEELIEEVGTDAARYFFLMRSLDSQLDFDLDLAKKKSNDNPVYYIQYAHARISSIFRQAKETHLVLGAAPKLELLTDESEQALIKKIMEYPEEVGRAADDCAPQRIARYSYDLAALFHSFYNKCRIMGVGQPLAEARLALVTITAHVIRHSLGILGVSAPEQM